MRSFFGTGWYCDPVVGAALVDGVFVVTDSINHRYVDRVMPILKEEQVIFCRLLRDRLKSRERVVDVGTGSGILGLYAAKVCESSVVALDYSSRACRFARANSELNGVPISTKLRGVLPGHMAIVHQELSRYCKRRIAADVFILNPPFTPALDEQTVALHARGGFDGQQAMLYQFHALQPLLKPGNRIIGFQMTCGSPPDFGLGEVLRTTMQCPFDAEWCSAIDGAKTIPAKKFLPAIYANCGIAKDRQSRMQSFADLSVLSRSFSLIMYVVTVKRSGSPRIKRMALPNGPLGTWADRIWLHQRILDGIPEPIGPVSSVFEP